MPWWKFWEDLQPSNGSPDYYEEGVSLTRQELFHEALTCFQLALKAKPDDPATYEQMAVAYTHIGLVDEAVKRYRESLRIRPNSPSAHYGLAFLLLREGDRAGATGHLEAYLASDAASWEEDRHVKHARDTLEQLVGTGRSAKEEATPSLQVDSRAEIGPETDA